MEFADGRLITEISGPCGWLTFNQPERLNAIRLDMWLALPEAVAQLDDDEQTAAIVVRGAGTRAFISGADIGEFGRARYNASSNRPFTEAVMAATRALSTARKPVIAMIRGYCIGGGVVIASACDMRLCSHDARFGVPAARLGLGYELDNYKRLAAIVGAPLAIEMLTTARQLTAEEALQARFVSRVCPSADLEATVASYVGMIAANAPMTIRAAKMCSRAILDPSVEADADAAIDACFDSEDYLEGRAAFSDKRPPKFSGR
jgi:enoyl-CoA hydratase/carnithine racemase